MDAAMPDCFVYVTESWSLQGILKANDGACGLEVKSASVTGANTKVISLLINLYETYFNEIWFEDI